MAADAATGLSEPTNRLGHKPYSPSPVLLLDARLRQAVIIKLQQYWSPQQIAGWLKRSYPGQEDMHISHETIYKTLYVQARGALKKDLIQYLCEKRRLRRSRYAKQKTDKRGQIKDAISISERPAEDRNDIPAFDDFRGSSVSTARDACGGLIRHDKRKFA